MCIRDRRGPGRGWCAAQNRRSPLVAGGCGQRPPDPPQPEVAGGTLGGGGRGHRRWASSPGAIARFRSRPVDVGGAGGRSGRPLNLSNRGKPQKSSPSVDGSRVPNDPGCKPLTTPTPDVAEHEPPLAWLSQILWPDGSTRLEPGGNRSHWASPSVGAAKILIPVQSAAARRAVRRYHDGLTVGSRMRSLLAEGAMSVSSLSKVALKPHLVGTTGSCRGGIPEALSLSLIHIPSPRDATLSRMPSSA